MGFKTILAILLFSPVVFAITAKEARKIAKFSVTETIDKAITVASNNGQCKLEFPEDRFIIKPNEIIEYYKSQGFVESDYWEAAKVFYIEWCEK